MIGQTLTISAIIGFLMSPAIDVINREKWNATVQAVSAFTLCLVAAIVTVWFDTSLALNWHDFRGVFLVVFTSAIGSYHLYWKPSGVSAAISKATG